MPLDVPFAQRLTEAMTAQNMRVADLVGGLAEVGIVVHHRSVRRWRNGQTVPGLEALPGIARVLGVSSDFLLGLQD